MSMFIGWLFGTIVALIINLTLMPSMVVAFLVGALFAGLGMVAGYAWDQHNEWKRWR